MRSTFFFGAMATMVRAFLAGKEAAEEREEERELRRLSPER